MKNLTLVLAVTSIAAHARNKLEEVVVISSRIEMPLRQITASIAVVTKDDSQPGGFSTVTETLRYEPSITLDHADCVGKTTDTGIREKRGLRTTAYIDGSDASGPSAPQDGPNFTRLLSGPIYRVETLIGPKDLAHGVDADGAEFTTEAPAGEMVAVTATDTNIENFYDSQRATAPEGFDNLGLRDRPAFAIVSRSAVTGATQ